MSGVPDSVIAENIRSVEIGFNELQVEAILGKPVERVVNRDISTTALYYSERINLAHMQPRVLIILDSGLVQVVAVDKMVLWGEEPTDYFYYKDSREVLESDDFDELFR